MSCHHSKQQAAGISQQKTEHGKAQIQCDQNGTLGHSGNTERVQGMLWGQTITVYTDCNNLMQNALGLTSD